MNGDQRTTRLRLVSARHRVRAFIEQVRYLEASSFPHPDGKEALHTICDHFKALLQKLKLPDDATPRLVDMTCRQAAVAIQKYTPVLGFILRSTNVRNAFEVHYPLKRILQALIGPDAKLLISSEWNFVPFTYPMSLDLLPRFALVGGPATESNNVLILPLAGHEIGHSAWRTHPFLDIFRPQLIMEIELECSAQPNIVDKLKSDFGMGDLGYSKISHAILARAEEQLEEIFCDTIGLGIFGTSFLYSYEYFLAPGGLYRNLSYPSDLDRVKYLMIGSRRLELEPDEALFSLWNDSPLRDASEKGFVQILDVVVSKVAEELIGKAINFLKEKGISSEVRANVERVERAFLAREPDDGDSSLAEIICAGWNLVRKSQHENDKIEDEYYRLYGELMLKSLEVSEFRVRMKDNA